jgi:hypothetical protein
MDGKFTIPSSRMTGSYRERSFDYEILQVDRQDGETIGESEKERIDVDDIRDADRIFYTLKKQDEEEQMYKWVAGPFPNLQGVIEAIEDIEVYGSPEPLPDFSKVQ